MEFNRLPETNFGVVTSWIPVPTVFPVPAGCNDKYWSYVPNTIAAWDPGYGISVEPTLTCLPKPVTTWWDAERLGTNSETMISLGPLSCPDAYTTAYTSPKDASSTFVACCPRNYRFIATRGPGNTGQCISDLRPNQVITYAAKTSETWTSTLTTTVTADTTVAGIQINGWVFATPTGTTEANGTCNAAPNTLSTEAKVGIGVGISFGVTGLAAFITGLVMMWKARRSSPLRSEQTPPAPPPQQDYYRNAHDSRYQKTGPESRVDPYAYSSSTASHASPGSAYAPSGPSEISGDRLAPEVEPKVIGGMMRYHPGSTISRMGPTSSRDDRSFGYSQHS